MAVDAKPYREGKGWVIRLRYKGNEIYLSGRKTAAQATKDAQKEANHIDLHGQPAWGGPKGKTVAQALQRQAAQTLRFKKGGVQEARRINCFLRHAGLDEIVLTKIADNQVQLEELPDEQRLRAKKASEEKKTARVYFTQAWRPAQCERSIPNSLRQHRRMLSVKTADSDRIRAQIARSKVTEVTTDLLQSFVDALVVDGTGAATVYQEVAILRQLFSHARKRWKWREPEANPASQLELPEIDNLRNRVMSLEEQERLIEALKRRKSAQEVVPLVALATESAMRAEELVGLTWSEVRTDEFLIMLDESKVGARSVPLSPAAVEILNAKREGAKSERVFPGMTYSKLASAWRRACKEAGVKDLKFHDVRATAATRFALGPAGRNVFLIQALTGHKTLVMLQRYVRISASDAARVMREQVPAAAQSQAAVAAPTPAPTPAPAPVPVPDAALIDTQAAQAPVELLARQLDDDCAEEPGTVGLEQRQDGVQQWLLVELRRGWVSAKCPPDVGALDEFARQVGADLVGSRLTVVVALRDAREAACDLGYEARVQRYAGDDKQGLDGRGNGGKFAGASGFVYETSEHGSSGVGCKPRFNTPGVWCEHRGKPQMVAAGAHQRPKVPRLTSQAHDRVGSRTDVAKGRWALSTPSRWVQGAVLGGGVTSNDTFAQRPAWSKLGRRRSPPACAGQCLAHRNRRRSHLGKDVALCALAGDAVHMPMAWSSNFSSCDGVPSCGMKSGLRLARFQ